jgi:hypothetical protein
MDLDLDINNYKLYDLLNLFKLRETFDEVDLKRAKQIVLKTHPDKSGLDSKYFLFYSKAFKSILQIWEFRKKGDINQEKNRNTEYTEYDGSEKENKRLLDQFFKKTTKLQDKNQFNQWFNEEFERNRIKTEEEELGYGDWLKSNENMDDIFTQNLPHNQLKDALDRKKAEMRTLTLRPEIQEVNSGRPPFGTNLIGGGMDYGSGLFDSLQYEDLKTAYTQTLIPVTEEDYDNRQKFHSVNELQSFRESQDTQPISEQQQMEYLNRRNKIDEEESVRRAYELMKQTEESEKKNAEFLQKMRLLK